MAEDVLAACMARGLLPERPAGATIALALTGAPARAQQPLSAPPGLHLYGTEAALIASLPGAQRELAPGLTEAMVRFAARCEYARSVEDVLARRSRLLFLDARLAGSLAARVAAILDEELGRAFNAVESERSFVELAARYARLPL
jgi:glycerol-3-phosphate dehydrogenase